MSGSFVRGPDQAENGRRYRAERYRAKLNEWTLVRYPIGTGWSSWYVEFPDPDGVAVWPEGSERVPVVRAEDDMYAPTPNRQADDVGQSSPQFLNEEGFVPPAGPDGGDDGVS